MHVTVSGKHVDVGNSLKNHIESDLKSTVQKYFDKAISADVVISKNRHLFRADVIVHEGTGTNITVKGSAEDDDVYAAYDIASAKIEKQLRRYKGKIKDHHKDRQKEINAEIMNAVKYVISSNYDESKSQSKHDEEVPIIIAEKPTQIERLTVSDAVMRMDLGSLPAVMFINRKTGALNVIYRREDGNISWIDTGSLNEGIIS